MASPFSPCLSAEGRHGRGRVIATAGGGQRRRRGRRPLNPSKQRWRGSAPARPRRTEGGAALRGTQGREEPQHCRKRWRETWRAPVQLKALLTVQRRAEGRKEGGGQHPRLAEPPARPRTPRAAQAALRSHRPGQLPFTRRRAGGDSIPWRQWRGTHRKGREPPPPPPSPLLCAESTNLFLWIRTISVKFFSPPGKCGRGLRMPMSALLIPPPLGSHAIQQLLHRVLSIHMQCMISRNASHSSRHT